MKNYVFPILFFLSIQTSYAQNFTWITNMPSEKTSELSDLSVDKNGNSYLTGSFQGKEIKFGDRVVKGQNDWSMFIAKYDSAGKCIWANSAFSVSPPNPNYSSMATGNGIFTDKFGNTYITGSFYDEAQFDNIKVSAQWQSFFIAKYDINGKCLWVRNSPTSKQSGGYDISMDEQGNLYLIGNYAGNLQIDKFSINSGRNQNNDILANFLVKFDADGNFLWLKDLGNRGFTTAGGIQVFKNNIYFYSSFVGELDLGENIRLSNPSKDYHKIYLAKCNLEGKIIWASEAEGAWTVLANMQLAIDSEENLYFTGNKGGARGFFLFKFDKQGKKVWEASESSLNYRTGIGLGAVADKADNIHVIAQVLGTTSFDNQSVGVVNKATPVILTYDKKGKLRNLKHINGQGALRGIGIDAQGSLYVGGYLDCFRTPELAIPCIENKLSIHLAKISSQTPKKVSYDACEIKPQLRVQPLRNSIIETFDDTVRLVVDYIPEITYQWFANENKIFESQNNEFKIHKQDKNSYTVMIHQENGCIWKTNEINLPQLYNSPPTPILSATNNIVKKPIIYPNPCHNQLNVYLGENVHEFTITITDLTGKQLLMENHQSFQSSIDLSTFSNGLYFIHIQANNYNFISKLIKN